MGEGEEDELHVDLNSSQWTQDMQDWDSEESLVLGQESEDNSVEGEC